MNPFTVHTGLVAPMDRANVDTDLIIPKQFLKSIKRSGFGPNLFDSLRYMDEGQPDQDCSGRPLNEGFCPQPAALSRRVHPAGPGELRLRFQPRARALGAGRLRLSLRCRPQLRRHLLQQLLQERLSAGGAGRGNSGGAVSVPLCPGGLPADR